MRFFVPAFVLLAAVASAQSGCNTNCITVPMGGIQVRAGGTYLLQWGNPSNGRIIIKLQPSTSNITPTSGITLATDVDARTGSYTVTIPSNVPASNQYTFEIIDSSNPSIINFSPTFSISGATGVLTSSDSSTGTATSSRASSTGTVTGTSSSVSAQSTSTDSTASRSSSQSASRSSSASTSAATTAAPNSNTNGASSLKVEGAALALIAAVAGLL